MFAIPTPRAVVCAVAFAASTIVLGCTPPKPPPAAPPPPAVTVAKPGSAQVQSFYEYNGYLDAVEMVQIKARIEGYLDEVHFAEGDEVKQGDKLYTIDPREYKATVARAKADIAKSLADIENAKAQIRLAEADLERFTRLSGAASKSEVDKATATLAATKAQLGVAAANKDAAEAALQTAELKFGYTDIRSPIAGRISRTLVTRGNLVGQNEATLLTSIVSVDPLYVYFDVPERDLVEYQHSLRERPQTAPPMTELPVEIGVATEPGFPHRGALDFRENRVETGTGTVRIRGRIPNPPIAAGGVRLLYPGLYSRVRVPNGLPGTKLVIPEDALMTGQEGKFVYVIGKENVVQKRTVSVGPLVWKAGPPGEKSSGAWTLTNPKPPPPSDPAAKLPPTPTSVAVRSVLAIEKGLNPDDLVIMTGLQRARPGTPVTPDTWDFSGPPAAK